VIAALRIFNDGKSGLQTDSVGQLLQSHARTEKIAELTVAIIRIRYQISLSGLLTILYIFLIVVSFFIPREFLAVAFDSGGVASGPMTSTFLLPLSIGACQALGGNLMTDAFGVVALVALTPLIAIQIMGLVYQIKTRKAQKNIIKPAEVLLPDSDDIIDFEEEVQDVE